LWHSLRPSSTSELWLRIPRPPPSTEKSW
jgi:hypothetical protein